MTIAGCGAAARTGVFQDGGLIDCVRYARVAG
jgi:hypothetical protein